MTKGTKILLLAALTVSISACSDRRAEERRLKEEAEAKARSDAARKEMDTLPKAFKSRDIFKKNEASAPLPSPSPESPKK